MMTFKKNFIFSLLINLFFSFTIIIYGPYEIFIANSANFEFTIKDFWWMPVIVAVVYLFFSTILFSILPAKICDICNILVFSFTLCCYIQAMILNSKMSSFTGEAINWSAKTVIANIIIWIVILTIVLISPFIVPKKWKHIIEFSASALIVMQMVALVSLLLTIKAPEVMSDDGYVSQKNIYKLSEKENVVVFCVDYFDARTMDAILAENPSFLEPLDGFTYFVNATSVHSRTYPSIPYLLTGNKCYFDTEFIKWVNESWENSTFIPTLSRKKIDIGLYTEKNYLGDKARNIMSNYEFQKSSLSFNKCIYYLAKMVLYRDLPYLVKQPFQYDSADINLNIFKEDTNDAKEEKFTWGADGLFYEKLITDKISLSNDAGCFRFYHLAGPHLNLSDPAPHGAYAMEIIYEYLRQMKELGIYENSTILIITDHGYSGGGDTLDMPHETAVPIFFVKPSNASDTELKISTAPISHTDFIPTVLNGFHLPYDDGKTVFDIAEGEERDRYYYYSALYSDLEGEIELREYLVDGDARMAENYHFTGQTWDILYSENKVFNQ